MARRDICPECNTDLSYDVGGRTYSKLIGVEYSYDSPERYDGVSEWVFPCCGVRIGRWSGNILGEGELEKRHGGED